MTTRTPSAAPASTACSASPRAKPPRRSATSTTRTASRWAPRSTARRSAATDGRTTRTFGRPAGGRRHVPERAIHPVHPRHDPHVPLRRRQSTLRRATRARSRAPSDSNCDDGNPCNGREFCNINNCAAGVPVVCDDGNQCNGLELCNENTGLCGPSNGIICDDDNECTTGTCRPDFLCTYTNVPERQRMRRWQPLHGSESGLPDRWPSGTERLPGRSEVRRLHQRRVRRDASTRMPPASTARTTTSATASWPATRRRGTSCVQTVPPLTCAPDTNPCTTDTCDPVLGCNWPNTNPCDDGNACTGPDACDGQGRCIGDLTPEAAACNLGDGNFCNGFEQCDSASGTCEHTDLDCSDGNDCTDDTCDPAAPSVSAACIHTTNTAPCNDQNACTGGDTCLGGLCTGTETAVAASCTQSTGNVCDGLATCDPVSGACTPRVPLNCDDGDTCNGVETCDPFMGCQPGTPMPCGRCDSLQCDDGNPCNGVETCDPDTGCQPGQPLVCDDGNSCNGVETCDPRTGCQPGQPLACNDGNACNGTETCDPALGCLPGTPLMCDDGNVCNGVETCNPASGCQLGVPLACDDGDACNGTETCELTVGCRHGQPIVCDDGDPCTDDSCSRLDRALHLHSGHGGRGSAVPPGRTRSLLDSAEPGSR